MKKIMFNDKFLLTQAVLEGRKTQTRRIYKTPKNAYGGLEVEGNNIISFVANGKEIVTASKYKLGEVVAVAQSYKKCDGFTKDGIPRWDEIAISVGAVSAGWDNKMFVRGDLMPHKIRITDVRVERLQDISDECCLKEGIIKKWHAPACKNYYYVPGVEVKSVKDVHDTPQEAFAHLINKVSGKGTWSSNPYVWVYDFELIK